MTRYAKNWLTPAEVTAMHHVAAPGRDKLVLELLYGCALRCGEMLALKVEDVDVAQSAVILRSTKTTGGTPQTMAVPPQVMVALKARIRDMPPGTSLVNLTLPSVYRLLQRLADRAGVKKKMGTHTLRRSRATNELESGTDLAHVRDLLRHKSIASTSIYLNYSTARIRKVQNGFKL